MSDRGVEERVARFRERCVREGLKVTHQRLEIFRVLAGTDEHPDAESVYRAVRERIPTISLDTVYRNLNCMLDHGLISIIGLPFNRFRFDGNTDPHHHFVCVKCGRIFDFRTPAFDGVLVPEEADVFGEVLSLQVDIKGICHTCRRKEWGGGRGAG